MVIGFYSWGREFPIFDDVIYLLEEAERDTESSPDEPIPKERSWRYGTARLVVVNASGYNFNHRALLTYLGGLRDVGMVHGFWACNLKFFQPLKIPGLIGIGFLQVVEHSRVVSEQ